MLVVGYWNSFEIFENLTLTNLTIIFSPSYILKRRWLYNTYTTLLKNILLLVVKAFCYET